jgi:hypothetical protein
MANEREEMQRNHPGTEGAENQDRDRKEQFNELSELSLEERMAVADQIGIPVANVGEAVATGTMSGFDESSMEQDERPEEDRNGE